MHFSAILFAIASFIPTVFAQLTFDDGLSPAARAQAKIASPTRAASILDASRCSQKAFNYFFDENQLSFDPAAIQSNSSLVNSLNTVIKDYSSFDLELSYRTICIGVYKVGQMNALSHSEGYMVFDPSLIDYLNRTFEKRSMYSLDQILFHEFAHQLQYWYGDRFQSDASVRRSELVSDCVAGSLLARNGKKYPADLWEITRKGMLEAAFDFGDFEFEDLNHHGLPLERYIAVKLGIDQPLSMTLKKVLNRCEDAIEGQFKQ